MRDGVPYDLIQGQAQGYEPLKVGNSAIFKGYLLPHLHMSLQAAFCHPSFAIFHVLGVSPYSTACLLRCNT